MEVEILAGHVVTGFAIGAGAWAFGKWLAIKQSNQIDGLETQIKDLTYQLDRAKGLAATYKSKWKTQYAPPELEPDPGEYIDPEADEDEQLSDLAEKVGLKLPRWAKGLIDTPAIQNIIIDQASKHPELVQDLLAKFTQNQPALPAQDKNTTGTNLA